MCASCARPENASMPRTPACVQVAQGVLLAVLHGSEGVNIRHHMHIYGRSELCAHQQANVCEVWACANICLCKDAQLGLGHSAVSMRSGHTRPCEDSGTCIQEGLCV